MQHAAKCWVRVAAYQAATCMPDPVLNLQSGGVSIRRYKTVNRAACRRGVRLGVVPQQHAP